MKCPKKNKFCHPSYKKPCKGQFICVGANKKPTKWKKDVVKLCLNGHFVKRFTLEMTPEEAFFITKGLISIIDF
jgi:hypothetical protein